MPDGLPGRLALASLTSGRRLALGALSGILLALSFPKFGHGAVAWVALVPELLALRGASWRQGATVGLTMGVVAGVGLLYWSALVVAEFGGLGAGLSVAAMFGVCLVWSLAHGAVGAIVAQTSRRHGAEALLLAPSCWVAGELVRTRTLLRFPWCLLGYSQHDAPALIQSARIAGVYGVSFAVAAVSACLAYALVSPVRSRRRAAFLAAPAIVVALWLDGSLALARAEPSAPRIEVALVQPNISQEIKWDPAHAADNITRHFALTRDRARGARLVVWPESAMPYLYDLDPGLAARLRGLAQTGGHYLMFGNDDVDRSAERPRRFVGAKLLSPEGELTLRYHKMRLVPFGEYVPFEPLFTLGGRVAARLVQSVADFVPGDVARVGDVDGHGVAPLICYEVIFPDLVRAFVDSDARLLVSLTNDAWYRRTSAPYQHFAMGVFRSVETGRYLVRAANTGFSGVVDSRGRVVARSELFETAVLRYSVPLLAHRTPYVRFGDAFAWLAVALTLLGLAWPRTFVESVAQGSGRR